MKTMYVDGGCSGNGQRDLSKRRMVAVVVDADGVVLSEQTLPGGSNNIAELIAVSDALGYCERSGVSDVTIYTDSQNNLAWVLGRKIGKDINDRPTVVSIKERIDAFLRSIRLTLEWIPRERNLAGIYIERAHRL